MSSVWVGVDTGGTFTDVVALLQDGTIRAKKLPSTPEDYSQAVIEGLAAVLSTLDGGQAELREVVHGTTVATNAILEGKGARAGLITTKGFRDVLEVARHRRPQQYGIGWQKTRPLVPRYLRLEVDERLDHLGRVLRPLDPNEVEAALDLLLDRGAESVAVCLFHSYANPAHERLIQEVANQHHPGLFVSLSSSINPEPKEYERSSTTVVNAVVQPVVARYLDSLERMLRRTYEETPLFLMQCNGGKMGSAAARERPVEIIESGPAAGVVACKHLSDTLGLPNLITFDMGGTTAKASLVEHGEYIQTVDYEVGAGVSASSRLLRGAGHTVRVPAIDLAEVGAGAGSIVWLDQEGVPRVGPHSAGADPGPACYGQGGTEPTITDVNLVLGYLNPYHFLGGEKVLDQASVLEAFEVRVAGPLGLSVDEAAFGARELANEQMIRALKAVSAERGRDPREFILAAFGGAGPVHAVDMARLLGISQVIVPVNPGLWSAAGLLMANLQRYFSAAYRGLVTQVDLVELNRIWDSLEDHARATLEEERYDSSGVSFSRSADLRYVEQAWELTIGCPAGRMEPAGRDVLIGAFGAEHQRRYGHQSPTDQIEIVHLRITANAPRAAPAMAGWEGARLSTRSSGSGRRMAYFGPTYGKREVAILGRGDLGPRPTRGPLVIEEYDSTTVVPPYASASLDRYGNITIDLDL